MLALVEEYMYERVHNSESDANLNHQLINESFLSL